MEEIWAIRRRWFAVFEVVLRVTSGKTGSVAMFHETHATLIPLRLTPHSSFIYPAFASKMTVVDRWT